MTSTKDSLEPGTAATPSSPQLLVLDDEASVRKLMTRILQREGYQIHETATFEEACAAAKALRRLDVFVTDANVEGTDASLEIERFRSLHPNLAVVLVSGCDPEAERHEILSQLGVVFLAKPFTPIQLRDAVDQALRRGSSASTVVSLTPMTTAAVPAAR